jgi:hypothetical protein
MRLFVKPTLWLLLYHLLCRAFFFSGRVPHGATIPVIEMHFDWITDLTLFNEAFGSAMYGIPSQRPIDGELLARPSQGGNHPVRFGQGRGERLFHENVSPVL